MKYFIIIAVLFGVVFTNPMLKKNQSKSSWDECIAEISGTHVKHSHFLRKPQPGEVQRDTFTYDIPGKPSGVYISCITVEDIRESINGYQSEVKINAGGLYQSYVVLQIISEIDNGFEYNIDIELNKPPIDFITEKN